MDYQCLVIKVSAAFRLVRSFSDQERDINLVYDDFVIRNWSKYQL